MKVPLKLGVLEGPVTVGFVEKPDLVWISPDTPREDLMDRLEIAKLGKFEKIVVGGVAATVFSEDGALYRVVVLSIAGNEVEVRYCDYGNSEKKGMDELLKLPDDLAKQEQLAVLVKVDGVRGVGDSAKNRARVEKKLCVEGLMVTMEKDKDVFVGTFEVAGKKIKFSKNKETVITEEDKSALVKPTKCKDFEKNTTITETKIENNKDTTLDKAVVVDKLEKTEVKTDELKEKRGVKELNVEKTSSQDNTSKMTSAEKIKESPGLVSSKETQAITDTFKKVTSEKIKAVQVPVSSGKLVMYSQLPNLKLLEGVEISGNVVYVSPLGGVWFCPQWIQASLDELTIKVDELQSSASLSAFVSSQLKEGMLVIARNSMDGDLYRARVVTVGKQITVNYIDFGDTDLVELTEVFYLPSGLEMMAPAAAEVLLARELPKQNTKELLEESLMEEEGLVLVLEKDSTGARVGKFYACCKEIKWNHMVESNVFEREEVDQENNEDVVIENAVVLNKPEVKVPVQATPSAKPQKPEEKTPEQTKTFLNLPEQPKKTVPVVTIPSPATPSLPKLTRLVSFTPLNLVEDESVFIVHVESVNKIWVCREDDEVRVSLMMDKLARMVDELKPAPRMKRGAVYGAKFSEDGEMYRAVLKEAVDDGKVRVQFIDFGNMETKAEKELFDIPEDIGSSRAAAILVEIRNDLEDTEENKELVENTLEGDDLTVTVKENGICIFKMADLEVKFNQLSSQNTSSLATSNEDMANMDEMKQIDVVLKTPVNAPATSLPVKESRQSAAGGNVKPVAAPEGLSLKPIRSKTIVSPLATTPSIPLVQTKAPNVPIPTPVTPQPVPTRTFAKALSAVQSQVGYMASKKLVKVVQAKETVTTPTPACQWSVGDRVVAKWRDGMWRQAIVVMVDTTSGQARLVDGEEEVMVSLFNLRPQSLPVEALNLIDQGLKRDKIIRQKGDGASCEKKLSTPAVVGKVEDWMDKNLPQLKLGLVGCSGLQVNPSPTTPNSSVVSKHLFEQVPLPPSQDLAGYSRSAKGSLHLQAVLNTYGLNESTNVLSSLLTSAIGPLALMTSSKSSYVIQKLITVLPSSHLQPLMSTVLAHFIQLSLDSSGCRVVQSMLEFSSPDQQRAITSLICNTKTILSLATDMHGTYVAQACLPHLTSNPISLQTLVNSLMGYTAMLGHHQHGTFFIQRLVGVLSTHYPGSVATCQLQEDILASLDQVAGSEPGSRLVQAMLKDTQPNTLVRVARWVVVNKKVVSVTKPAVFVALAVLEQIVERLAEEGSWANQLDKMFRAFLEKDEELSQEQAVLITAALHPVGHLLSKEMVSKVNRVDESTKTEVMRALAIHVERLSADKFGAVVLKGLAVAL